MFMIFFISLFVSIVMILLNSFIGNKSFNDREKLSPFECGFNPMYFSRSPFSMQFFLIAIIFLIFDVEITLILPIPIIFFIKSYISWIFMSTFFIFILIVGLYHEWAQGALFWPK
uniref:NADH-ubiquinone oxidoreductase chain 3 n=1 Tax=Allonychiurus kimi TaxID=2779777 RepID=A0A7M3UYU1_9HEXA|nr:NADH dehydrogenase subunit 3 [Allonychiurus kimi]QOL12118.1 NADH dehydrogenase subunit 3 [Allonychiurus kimi]